VNNRFYGKLFLTLLISMIVAGCGTRQQLSKSQKFQQPLLRFESNELYGYKDTEGNIVTEAKFSRADARYFENIMVVEEKDEKSTELYYLTRSGKKLGTDKVYSYGYNYDCEREGHIRFKDPFTSNVGLYNSNGKIIIPAIYDDLSPVTFGYISAIKNAEKSLAHSQQTYSFGYKYYRDHLSGGCNHITWSGGIKLLLNDRGDILIKNFNYKGRLDYNTLEINERPSSDDTKESFKGVDGKFYVFTNIEKDFRKWFEAEFLDEATAEKFTKNSMDSLMYYRPLSYDRAYFDRFYNNCYKAMKDKYPVLEVKQYLVEEETEYKTVIKFLKTERGYQIFDIRIE